MAKAEVKNYNGSPALMIDGKPYPPMMATIRTIDEDMLFVDEKYYEELGKSGIKIFFLICDNEWIKPGAFELFANEAEKLLKVVPDAYIVARIGMHPSLEWVKENPGETVMYSDGKPKPCTLFTESYVRDYPAMYSLCSSKWREDAGKALLSTYDKMCRLPYADRIIGFFFAAGGTSEWYYITPTEYTSKTSYLDTGGWEQTNDIDYENVYADLSPAFKREFVKYLKAKYSTDEELQKAWKNEKVTLEDPYIPDCSKRYYIDGVDYDIEHPGKMFAESSGLSVPDNGTNIGHFIDVENNIDVYDFFRAWHKGVADSVIYFGNIIKKADPYKLTGAFYGSAGSVKPFCFGQIGSVNHILESGAIDFLASPSVYENRQPGGFAGQRQCFDSFRLKNRMFVCEEDTRTHFENLYYQGYFEMYEMSDTFNVLKREFGRIICTDIHAWWFDQIIGGKRFKAPEIYSLFSQQSKIASEAYSLDRSKRSEVAFIYDEDSYHLISAESTHQMTELFNNYEIEKIGMPSDRYFKTDFLNENMPDYKLYVFLNSLCMSEKEREKIIDKLRKNNAVALFMYGSGIIDFEADEKFSSKNVEKITGIHTEVKKGVFRGKFKINGDKHPITENLDRGEIYGDFKRKMWANMSSFMNRIKTSNVNLCPLIYTNDENSSVLAYFCDSKLPALTYKENDGYRSLYCGSKYLSCDVIKEIARFAGCHIYSETDDVFYANKNYITFHAATSGIKTIKLPGKFTVKEVYEDKTYATESESVCFELLKGETKMFLIIPCD